MFPLDAQFGYKIFILFLRICAVLRSLWQFLHLEIFLVLTGERNLPVEDKGAGAGGNCSLVEGKGSTSAKTSTLQGGDCLCSN